MSRLHLRHLSPSESCLRRFYVLPPLSFFRRRTVVASPNKPQISCRLSHNAVPKSSEAKVFHGLTFARSRIVCRVRGSDITPHLELGKPEDRGKPQKRVNGIIWIILINLGIYVADHLFQVRGIKALRLHHNCPSWYQFVTATFCHDDWSHLSRNMFFLYIFGKPVEEEEGTIGLWLTYLFTGVGANLVPWLLLNINAVSYGASGAVFGLFVTSVLVTMSWNWRKFHEVLILGQFVVEGLRVEIQRQLNASKGHPWLGNVLTLGLYHGIVTFIQTVVLILPLAGALAGLLTVRLLMRFSPDRWIKKCKNPKDYEVKGV